MTHILLAEDETFIGTLYKSHLEKHEGVKVKLVGNGKQALQAIDNETFDLIILDLIMPTVDGYEVLAQLKRKENKIPVIVMSNLSLDIDKAECERLGAVDYIVKADNDAPDIWEKLTQYLSGDKAGNTK